MTSAPSDSADQDLAFPELGVYTLPGRVSDPRPALYDARHPEAAGLGPGSLTHLTLPTILRVLISMGFVPNS